ncbi:MAG: hypothetical protein ACREP7_13375 [Lysobacter sp.]
MAIATHLPASQFLRRVVAADALVSGAAGVLQLAAAEPLSHWLAIDAGWLRGAGMILLGWFAFLGWTLSRREISAARAWTIIGVNVAWIAASALVLVEGAIEPNTLGMAFVLAQAAAVAVFAELEFFGLRKQQRG